MLKLSRGGCGCKRRTPSGRDRDRRLHAAAAVAAGKIVSTSAAVDRESPVVAVAGVADHFPLVFGHLDRISRICR